VDTYIVQKGDTLYGIAKRFNTSVQSIKEINNLKNNTLSIGQQLKIKNNDDSEPVECIVYTVKKGDNLYSIARKYDTTVDEIKRYNNLKSNLLSIGDRIVIPCNETNDYTPGGYVSYTVEKNDTLYSIANKFGTTVDKIKKDNDLRSNTLTVGTVLIIDDIKGVSSVLECYGNSSAPINNNEYVVQKGDTLYGIAQKFNTTVNSIVLSNNLKNNNLFIGQKLIIPNNDNEIIHTVQKGESLYNIAKKYNVSVDQIKKKNNLSSNLISIGQKLKI